MNIILNIQITSEAWVKQQDIEIYFALEKNGKQEELKITEFILVHLVFPSAYFRASYSQEYESLPKPSAGCNEHRRKTQETNNHASTLHRHQPYANLSHLSKRLTKTKALYYGFGGPQMSFLLVINLPNNHSVAVWHSICKCLFISLEPDNR